MSTSDTSGNENADPPSMYENVPNIEWYFLMRILRMKVCEQRVSEVIEKIARNCVSTKIHDSFRGFLEIF